MTDNIYSDRGPIDQDLFNQVFVREDRKNIKVFIFTTFALFSDGKRSIDLFNDAYEKGYFDKVYSTNLTYVPEQIKESPWYHEVDCSNQLAQVINTLNLDESIEPLMNGKEKILKRVANIKKR